MKRSHRRSFSSPWVSSRSRTGIELLALVLAISGIAICIAAEAQQTATISGRVVDSSGHPMQDLTVEAYTQPLALKNATPAASTTTQSDGSFALMVSPGSYVVQTAIPPAPMYRSFTRVDTRGGNASGVLLRVGAQTPLIPDHPPRLSLIHATLPDGVGEVLVTGKPGATFPASFLLLVTIDTGHVVNTIANDDGSFSAKLYAPAGSSILVKADPFSAVSRHNVVDRANIGAALSLMAGTIVRVPEPASEGGQTRFSRAGVVFPRRDNNEGPAAWSFDGTLSSQSMAPGQSLRVQGAVRLSSSALKNAGSIQLAVKVNLDKVAGPDGTGSLAQNTFASVLLTPTQLPIERARNGFSGRGLDVTVNKTLTRIAEDRVEGTYDLTLELPADLPHGYYIPVATLFFDGVPAESPPSRPIMTIDKMRRDPNMTYLPIVRVGASAPPRIPAMLFGEPLINGSRGVRAVEDHNHFALSTRLRMSDAAILPRVDASGDPLRYRLEPFLPTIGLTVVGNPNLPLIPFRYPSGQLTVQIHGPDGSMQTIGPKPFLQARLKSSGFQGTSFRDHYGSFFYTSGPAISEIYQLTTLDPAFDIEFTRDGDYVARVDGFIEDIWGNTWLVGGTYAFRVARLLSLDPAVIPGTPFEVGDHFTPAVVIAPPVMADVEYRIRFAPDSDPSRMIERVFRGRANRFGYFKPPGSHLVWTAAGEYRVDVTATFTDSNGNLHAGSRTWGNVIAPRDAAILAHGRRGLQNTDYAGQPWYFRSQTPFPTFSGVEHSHLPFHSGDVFWAQKSDDAFVASSFQDPAGVLTSVLEPRLRSSAIQVMGPGSFEQRVPLGELPLFSTTSTNVEPHVDPSRVDLWGYSYRFVERPMIAVRELIAEDGVQLAYWPFSEQYGGQFGAGGSGDLPNDFKFFFSGVVLRGSALARPLYSIYGSLFVLVPDDDGGGGSRVFPPFQGNGSGPSGGPLFRLKGREIDLFFHATSIRPGSLLETGDSISLSGYSAPPLPSKLEVTVIAPSGKSSVIRVRANRIGYFYDPTQDFTADEDGVWRAKVKMTFDGVLPSTSAAVVSPFPIGDVLGTLDGEFSFYVVNPRSPALGMVPVPRFVRPAAGPIPFTLNTPAGLRDVELSYTINMPGLMLEEKRTSSTTVVYDAPALARDNPNLDLRSTGSLTGADTITISVLVSGIDERGVRQYYARQIVLQGEEVQAPEQTPLPPSGRRRAVRRN